MIALLASGVSVTAQNRGNEHHSMNELKLTDDQKAKMKVLHQEFAKQDSISKVQFKKQREVVMADRRLAMSKILTPEQLLQMDKIRVEREKRAGQKGQFGPGNGRPGFSQGRFAGQGREQMMRNRFRMMQQMHRRGAQMSMKGNKSTERVDPEIRIKKQMEHLSKVLDLTTDQEVKIQAIQMKNAKEEIDAYKNHMLKKEAQVQKNATKMEEIKALLTPEQIAKMEAQQNRASKKHMGPKPQVVK